MARWASAANFLTPDAKAAASVDPIWLAFILRTQKPPASLPVDPSQGAGRHPGCMRR
jgi:hypothetical protein